EVREQAPLQEILSAINGPNLGFALVTENDRVLGIITDGDLRRALLDRGSIAQAAALDLMTRDPLAINPDRTAAEALEIMERKLITALVVVEQNGKLAGIIHLHDLLGKGEIRFSP
ncbi:MAG: CBS domain-containing protein, partial [Thermodesulfobacteriota bacterium]